MTDRIADTSLRKAAIVAGIAILIMAVAAVVANDVTIERLIVPGDAAATTKNIQSSEMLFRIGMFSWLAILICDLLAAWGLYVFLKPVNTGLSLLMAWFRLVYVAILGAALVNFVIVLLLVGGDGYLAAVGIEQLQVQVVLFLNAFDDTWSLGLEVFGIHIFLLGYLAFKSGYIPKIFGILLFIAFVGYFITSSANLLLPVYEEYEGIVGLVFLIPMVIGEVGLAVWLLWKGVKISEEEVSR